MMTPRACATCSNTPGKRFPWPRAKPARTWGKERTLEFSLTRLVEIVGEAAARVSPETRSKHPDIPWQEITGLRNRLIHGYDTVDLDILWNIVELDLPPLVKSLAAILKE